jgi:hypothetical protein
MPQRALSIVRGSRPLAGGLAVIVFLSLALVTTSAAGTQQVGPYTVVDSVTHDFAAETTTASYTVTVPAGAKDLSHLSLKLLVCTPSHEIVFISPGGTVENQDPSTGMEGPLIKWDTNQKADSTATYSYSVAGLFAASPTSIVLKSADSHFATVAAIGCEPLPANVKVQKTDDTGAPMAGVTFELFTDSGGAVGTATGQACTTAGDGSCEISDIAPGTYWVVETTELPDHQEAAPQQVTLGQSETRELSFTNNREFTKIVLVCHGGRLYSSTVSEGGETKTSLAGLAPEQEAQLCGLGGARFEGNVAGTTSISIDIS